MDSQPKRVACGACGAGVAEPCKPDCPAPDFSIRPRRPVAIVGHAPTPQLHRQPRRAVLGALHLIGYALWCWADERMDDDQPRRA